MTRPQIVYYRLADGTKGSATVDAHIPREAAERIVRGKLYTEGHRNFEILRDSGPSDTVRAVVQPPGRRCHARQPPPSEPLAEQLP